MKGFLKNTTIILILVLVIGTVIFQSCKKEEDNSNNSLFDSYDKKSMLTNLSSNALQNWKSLKLINDSFQKDAEIFKKAPSVDKIASLKIFWKHLQATMKVCEFQQFVSDQMTRNYPNIDYWPVRTQDVETFILASDSISVGTLSQKGTIYKGLPIMEFLLFSGNSDTETLASFQGNKGEVKRGYLLSLSQTLDLDLKVIISIIESNITVYNSAVVQDASGSINFTVNELVKQVEILKNNKVGKPAGKKDGNLYPSQVESYFAKNSIGNLINSLNAGESIMNGGGTGKGFYDMLDYLQAENGGVKLSTQISNQFELCRKQSRAIGIPMDQALTSNPKACDDLYLSLKKLIVLLKVDMSSKLGVIITFTDNDGD